MNSGKIRPQPLVIRANAGDCIEVRMTNFLPDYIEESPFQLKTLTDIAGFHIHLVKFDTIVSDGAANGWNNIAGARKYETLIERFNANEELNTVFFHDHLFANVHQQHGLFGALIVEPAGSVFLNPKNGRPLKSGANAVIKRADGSSFREFAMFVHDFALLFDKDDRPLNPPEHPGSDDDPGVMGISYRCEPMIERLKKKNDPSHIFSSRKYGDPATPVLETYPGDPIKGGHRHNLLDPEFQYFGIGSSSSGSMDSQGVHKFGGYVQSDKKLVCWPSDGVTVTNSLYRTSSFNWTIKLCDSDYTFTDDTTITVELLNTGDVWTFDKDTPNTDNCNYYRFKNLLSFYNSEMPLSKGNVFKVTVGDITNEETGELSEYSYRSVIETLSTYEGSSVTDIELDKDSAQMNVGEKIKLNAKLTPYAPDNAMVYWLSSDENIATVSPNGFVTAKKGGNAVITAVSEDGSFAASCTVTVTTMLIGDVNDDKKINLFDAVLVNKQSLGYGSFTGAQTVAADVNSDSIVNLLDAIYIQKYVIGIPVDVPINTPLE